ncbi:hypothetical protein ACJRO7_006623 [Eucalyptus globulus]|uniref:Uncharacterized protein n=1 Tax=Eucalyptus globulus TaxID=34317 RepID=A0ABD3IL45_EUCGL
MQAKTLALKEEDEKKGESLGGDLPRQLLPPHSVSTTYIACLIFLFRSRWKCGMNLSHKAIGAEPTEELIDEIDIDDEWSSLLASFASTTQAKTLALKEEEEKSESLGGDSAETALSHH